MHFDRLRLQGFKSFVEPAELRIERGLTGVVGPNGCGKSNLLEAIRWVMGEGSPKLLRGGGMEDVIFAGTARRPARDTAEVMLVLDNRGRTAPAALNDDDKIEVVRRIERGAGSAYRVNGRDVRQRDVQLLFADAATGAHSPALVSQGRIGSIIAAKPAERRLLLEEAAGIAGLHVRRKEAEARLRATEVNLARLDDVVNGMETQATTLRRQARTAERYRTLSDRIRNAEAALLFARWTAASAAAAAAQLAAAAADAEAADATQGVVRLSAAQATKAAELPQLRDAEAAAAAAVQRLMQVQNALAAELQQVERRSRELAAADDALGQDMAQAATLAADATAMLAQLADEDRRVTVAAADAQTALPAAERGVADSGLATTAGEAALSTAMEAHAQTAAQSRAAAAEIDTAAARLTRATAETVRLQREQAALPDSGVLRGRIDAAAAAIAAATIAVTVAAAAIAAADGARRQGDTARDAANAALLAARGQVISLTAERDALARVLDRGDTARAGAIEAITVAAGYEAALAAALGDDLDASLGGDDGRFWVTAAATFADAPLPAGAVPLLAHVTAPAALTRRLAQVGVLADDEAGDDIAALRPGQRLVTRSGRLWRWDGFRAFGGHGEATAEALRQRGRLAAIATELAPAEAALVATAAVLSDADRSVALALDADRAARRDRDAAEQAHNAARRDHDAASADAARLDRRAEGIAAAIARAATDAAFCDTEMAAARAAGAGIADPSTLAEAVAAARRTVEASRAELAAARASHAMLSRDVAAAAMRHAAITGEKAAWTTRHACHIVHHDALAARRLAVVTEAEGLAERPAAIAAETVASTTALHEAQALRRVTADALVGAEASLRELDQQARHVGETLGLAREARGRSVAAAEHEDRRRIEIEAQCSSRFAVPPLRLPAAHGFDTACDPDALTMRFKALTAERERLGPVNLRAETELAEIDTTLAATSAERAEIETAVARLRGSIGALNREGRVRLLEAFARVDAHFRELFATLFAGGAAHLELIEADDPLEAGLEIMAQPPGKKLQSLTLLSGGEQALTAVALIFALFLTNPAPICVLDEVDAPLDDSNVERFCDLLDRMAATTETRFLIVTHNAVTMSRMHRLFGVTMAEQGVSQLVSVDLARAELLLAAE